MVHLTASDHSQCTSLFLGLYLRDNRNSMCGSLSLIPKLKEMSCQTGDTGLDPMNSGHKTCSIFSNLPSPQEPFMILGIVILGVERLVCTKRHTSRVTTVKRGNGVKLLLSFSPTSGSLLTQQAKRSISFPLTCPLHPHSQLAVSPEISLLSVVKEQE